MTRFFYTTIALVLIAAPCQAQSRQAVSLVPGDALGFLLIKDLHQLSDKVEHLAKKLNVEERVSLLELIHKEMGIREGLNDKGSAVFIVLKTKDEKNSIAMVLALPVSDRQKMAQQLAVKDLKDTIAEGEVGLKSDLLAGIGGKEADATPKKFPVLVARRGDFVLLAPPESRAGLEAVLHSKKNITASLRPVQDWLDEQDMAGICTDRGVSTGLAMFLNGPGGGAESSTQGQVRQLRENFAEVEKNVQLIAFGASIEKDGHSRLATRVQFQPEGSYAKWIAKAEPLREKLLARFPDQPQFATALARISAQTTLEGVAKYLLSELPADKRDALTKEMTKLVQQISEVGVCLYTTSKAGGPALPIKSAVSSCDPVLLAQVRDATTFLDDAVDLLRHASRAARSADKTKVEVNYQEKEIAGKPSRLITVRRGEQGSGKDRPQVFLLTALDGQTVLGCLLPDREKAEATVTKFSKQVDRSLATNASLQKTRKLLPDKLQVELLLDLQTFGILGQSDSGKTQVSHVAPLGFAMRALPAALEAQFVVPFDALKAVVDASKAKAKEKEK